MTLYQIVIRLTGPIEPVGSEHIDKEGLKNLIETIDLTQMLLMRIYSVSKTANRHEASVKAIGMTAKTFLDDLLAGEIIPPPSSVE